MMEKFLCGVAAQGIGMVSLLIAYLVVQMVSGGLSGGAHLPDDLTGQNTVPCLNTELLQTAVERSTAVFVCQFDAVAQNVVKVRNSL